MKKILISLLAICALLLSTQAQAQTQTYYKQIHPNEISASYGASFVGTMMGTVISKANDWFNILGVDDLHFKTSGSKGWINLGYTYQLNKTISVGATVGYTSMGIQLSDDTDKIRPGLNFFTFMSTAKFDWFRTKSDVFGMYSKVCLGGFIGNCNKDFSYLFNIPEDHRTFGFLSGHLSLIGLEVGKGFSGFAEFGIGMQGIAQVGIRARF